MAVRTTPNKVPVLQTTTFFFNCGIQSEQKYWKTEKKLERNKIGHIANLTLKKGEPE